MTTSKTKSFEDLDIWKLSHQAVLKAYKVTKGFPKKELFILTSQYLCAAISVPANIAEGMGRYSRKEFIQHLTIARGSTEESRYFVMLAKDLGYLTHEEFSDLNSDYQLIGKKINALINSIKIKNDDKK